jgi:hypothetical protein
MTVLPQTWPIQAALLALLEGISEIDAYEGGVPGQIQYDSDGKAHGYAVLHAGPGTELYQRMVPLADAKNFTFQITCVGGDDRRAIWVCDLVIPAIAGKKLTGTTTIKQEQSTDRVQIDRAVNPPRFWVPLLFSCRIT